MTSVHELYPDKQKRAKTTNGNSNSDDLLTTKAVECCDTKATANNKTAAEAKNRVREDCSETRNTCRKSPASSPSTSSSCPEDINSRRTFDPYTNEKTFQDINGMFASEDVLNDAVFKQFHYSPCEVAKFWSVVAKAAQTSGDKQYPMPDSPPPRLSEDQRACLYQISRAYALQLQTCADCVDPPSGDTSEPEVWPPRGQDSSHWRHLQERIARQTFAETQFVLHLAKAEGFLSTNLAKLTLNSCLFGNTILMASREWFDLVQKRFKFIWNWKLSDDHPFACFQNKVACLGELIYHLKLDDSEVALLSAFNIANPFNIDLDHSQQCHNYTNALLTLLTSYLHSVKLCPLKRIPELLSVMAPLRHMSLCFSNLIKNMRADTQSLDKTLNNLSKMAKKKSKERSVWRIPG